MKKELIWIVSFLIFFVGCKNNYSGLQITELPTVDNSWELTEAEANAMLSNVTCTTPPCRDATVMIVNPAKVDSVIKEFERFVSTNGASLKKVQWLDARYTANPNFVTKYAARHRFTPAEITACMRNSQGVVTLNGIKTKILKLVSTNTTGMPSGYKFYYDLNTICPPPGICDASSASPCVLAAMRQ
jgi:hypothetical protein